MRPVLAVLLVLWSCAGRTHDVVTNRLLLVQRETNHVSMTLVIDYLTTLRTVAAPKASHTEFVVACAGMGDAALQRTLNQAQATLERGIVLRDAQQQALRITPLRWPALAEARKLLQQAAMAAVALRTDTPEPSTLELQADAIASGPISSLDVQLPPALADVVIVSYKPTQTQPDGATGRARITF